MVNKISPTELNKALQKEDANSIVVDVRNPDELGNEKIHDAVNIPMDTLKSRIDSLRDYDQVFVVCRMGGRSKMAAEELEKEHIHSTYLEGGVTAWKEEGFPLE